MRRLAYHFTMRSEALDRDLPVYTAATAREAELWRAHHAQSGLWIERDGPASVVHDRRWGWTPRDIVLDAAEAFLLDQTWQPASWRAVLGEAPLILDEAALRTAADRLAAQGLLLIEGEMLLALPLRDGLHRSPTWREIRA